MKVSIIDINFSVDRPRLLWLIGLNKCLQKSAIATKYELQMSMIIFGSQMRQQPRTSNFHMNILSYRCLPESQCNTFDFLQVFKQPQNCSDFSNYEHSFCNLLQYDYYVHQGFHQVWYQSIVKATVSGVLEDLTF